MMKIESKRPQITQQFEQSTNEPNLENDQSDVAKSENSLNITNLSENNPKQPENFEEKVLMDPDGMFKCSQCKYQTRKKNMMIRHVERMKNIHKMKYECTICKHMFDGKQRLNTHMNLHIGPKPFQCQECDGSYNTPCDLQRHMRYKHTHEKPYKCTECSYAAVERSKLARHMIQNHTKEGLRQCPHCNFASADSFKLARHLRRHIGERPYRCTECDARFIQATMLKIHMQRKHLKLFEDYSCKVCHAMYASADSLRIHLQRQHGNISLKECTKCSARFSDKFSLKNHIKMHNRSKKFKCKNCPYKAWTKKQLVKHAHQHKDSLFKCDDCKKIFMAEEALIRHDKLLHNINTPSKYTCNECGKDYHRKKDLAYHIHTYCKTHSTNTSKTKETNAPDFFKITKQLKDGEVVVLPKKCGEKFIMMEILHNEHVDPKIVKKIKNLKEFYSEIERNRSDESDAESDIEFSDDDQKLFYGF